MSKSLYKAAKCLLAITALVIVCSVSLISCGNGSRGGDAPVTTVAETDAPKAPVDFTALTYAAFGDSITYGYDSAAKAQMEQPYPTLVAESLGLSAHENFGVGDATVCEDDSDRFCISSAVCSAVDHYDIISVWGGVNDYCYSLPLGSIADETADTVYGAFSAAAKHLVEAYPDSFVFFITPLECLLGGKTQPCTAPNSEGYDLEAVAGAIKDVGEKYGIPVLDMYSIGNFASEMDKPESDGVHPSQAFISDNIAPAIAAFIRDNMV